MGKFSGVLIACDVDGTLVEGGVLSDENAKAIRWFIKEGGLFTVATGRTPNHIKEHYMPSLSVNAPMICVNGTVIADEGEILWEQKMPKVHGKMIKLAREFISPEQILLYTFSETVKVEDKIPEGDFYKILIVTKTPEDALLLKEKLVPLFPECHFSRSWDTGLEATDKTAGKG
ncbi:MAG: HAD-IIB family hydrolase, partial [Clostridia bacterium]|nr:HAD-IIB family hydrolase [Clostridia bacterium]